jgi:hypothetical protein
MVLQRKLAEAKNWSDRLEALADDADEYHSDKEAVDLLKDIVEMCEQTWGFAE